MANIYNNDKGFLIIQMTPLEATNICNFGFKISRSLVNIVCDTCNKNINYGNVYYVAVLNRALCRNCVDEFITKYDKHQEDIKYEKQHYNYYAKLLNLKEEIL